MNTCTVYVCCINYDAYSLYKCINNRYTTQAQAAHAEDVFNSLPRTLSIKFDGISEWISCKKVLEDWTLPYMIRDEIFKKTGWRIISFDIAGISVNNNFVAYPNDMTFEFKMKRYDYSSNNSQSNEDEVIKHNPELNVNEVEEE